MVIALHLHCRGPEIDTRFVYIFLFSKFNKIEINHHHLEDHIIQLFSHTGPYIFSIILELERHWLHPEEILCYVSYRRGLSYNSFSMIAPDEVWPPPDCRSMIEMVYCSNYRSDNRFLVHQHAIKFMSSWYSWYLKNKLIIKYPLLSYF